MLQCGDHQRILQGSATDTTVNIMELTPVIAAVSALKQPKSTVHIFTDSQQNLHILFLSTLPTHSLQNKEQKHANFNVEQTNILSRNR